MPRKAMMCSLLARVRNRVEARLRLRVVTRPQGFRSAVEVSVHDVDEPIQSRTVANAETGSCESVRGGNGRVSTERGLSQTSQVRPPERAAAYGWVKNSEKSNHVLLQIPLSV